MFRKHFEHKLNFAVKELGNKLIMRMTTNKVFNFSNHIKFIEYLLHFLCFHINLCNIKFFLNTFLINFLCLKSKILLKAFLSFLLIS